MTDERAALIERLELMAIAEADTTAELIEDGADADVIACSRDEAQFFKACAAELARLSEEISNTRNDALQEAADAADLYVRRDPYVDDISGAILELQSGPSLLSEEALALREALKFFVEAVAVGRPDIVNVAVLKAEAALARAKGETK